MPRTGDRACRPSPAISLPCRCSSVTTSFKETKKPNFLELELPLNKADAKYLLYQVNCRPGKYFDNAVNFDEEGTIYEVTSFVPTPETMKPVGKFSVRPIAARPMLDRSLRC